MRAYPLELRQHAVALVRAGWGVSAVAQHLRVSASSIQRYCTRAEQGALAPTPPPGRPRLLSPTIAEALANQVRAHPQVTLAKLRIWLQRDHGIAVSAATVGRSLHRLGFRRLPRPRVRPPATD